MVYTVQLFGSSFLFLIMPAWIHVIKVKARQKGIVLIQLIYQKMFSSESMEQPLGLHIFMTHWRKPQKALIYIYIRTTITIRPLGKNISISIIKKRKIFIFISGWTCWVIKRVEMYTFKDPNQSVLISVRCLVMGQWSGLSWSRTPRREERIQSLSERVNITFGKLYTSNFQTTTFLRVCY